MPLSSLPDPSSTNREAAAPGASVILVDDDIDVRSATAQSLRLRGCVVHAYSSAEEALPTLSSRYAGCVVTDIRMPGLDGLQLFSRIRQMDMDIPVILITGHGDVDTVVQAMHDGAYDFLAKPHSAERLWRVVQRAQEKRSLVLENRRLREQARPDATGDTLIGTTPAIRKIRQTILQIADATVDVLIEGETGSGKEVVAMALHRASRRRDKPFVAINCGALPESVIESELFGHEAGAFTGAQKRRIGRVEYASGGTLFLDEIESMPMNLQVKLLRVLETRQVTPLGTNEVRTLDLRVVAATKEKLARPEARSYFREDLYYRLNVVTLKLPPLRERRQDIPLLFTRLVERAAKRFERSAPPIDDAILMKLDIHDWPGNVRELYHYAERFVLGLAELNEEAAAMDFEGSDKDRWPVMPTADGESDGLRLPEQIDQFEAEVIRRTLHRHKGDVRQTIETLGIARKTFYDKLQRHGIDRMAFVE